MTEPLVVCYGLGVDSTAVLVGLHQLGQRPDLVIFADVGAERPATMAYLAWQDWIARIIKHSEHVSQIMA